ncbi:MAG: septum formation initiator family protein [Lachnospiraceae bacterium]|nr:septum formation initiator family protein [Lachnospiraceae bacterium]
MAMKRNRYKASELLAMLIISVILIFLVSVFAYRTSALKEKKAKYDAEVVYLEEQIKKQEDRKSEIAAYGEYISTTKYVEDIARERFNLVYIDEVVLEADN